MGVWIETDYPIPELDSIGVTPFVGVWIETQEVANSLLDPYVTPFVGVWIETSPFVMDFIPSVGHTLRGCVD